jgi:hypothetical protein
MPKARLSPEEKIIEYFKTAPREIAGVVLKLATNELRRRSPAVAAVPRKAKSLAAAVSKEA